MVSFVILYVTVYVLEGTERFVKYRSRGRAKDAQQRIGGTKMKESSRSNEGLGAVAWAAHDSLPRSFSTDNNLSGVFES